MAAFAMMVTALKGSRMFLAARRAFSLGVSGLTSGPLMNRWKKLMRGGGGQGGSSCAGIGSGGFPLSAGDAASSVGGKPATVAMRFEPVSVRAMPADSLLGITRQGPL